MAETALYILTGLALYAGGHHLYLGTGGDNRGQNLQLGAFYLLLAGFALSSGVTYETGTLTTLLPAGKIDIALGLLLWLSLVWYVAFRTGFRPLILLDLVTAVWLIFMVRNIMEPNSLLYADVTPVNQTLMSGQTVGIFYASISPWWTAVEVAMLGSLAFCFYACYRQYRHGEQAPAVVTVSGLALLGAVSLHDHFVSTQAIQATWLAPYGFLLFLLPVSLYPLFVNWRRRFARTTAATVYNLPYMPDQASFHTDVSQLRTPRPPAAEPVAANHTGEQETPSPFKVRIVGEDTGPPSEEQSRKEPVAPETASPPPLDMAMLHTVTDNLIDIAVFATMALNRFKRGDADPQTLESLCRKIRVQAIKTRRLAHQLAQPEDRGGDEKTRR